MMRVQSILFVTLFALMANIGAAFVPHTINYQGHLTDPLGGTTNGVVSFSFELFDSITGGSALWSESHPAVTVQNGLFSVVLGSITPLTLDFDQTYYLEITVNSEALTPRQAFTSVGQAFRAEQADDVYNQDITPRSINIIGYTNNTVIDEQGRWVGDPTGLIGATGPQGATGAGGVQGIQGDTGLQGLTGETGVQGTAGEQGATGIQGLIGDTGLQGLTGEQGATGAEGLVGATGSQGLQGEKGDTGSQGLTGEQGATGAEGLVGATGPQGLQGLKGDTGSQGLTGEQGATGVQGLVGETGPQGLQGIAGDTGLQGLTGEQGATGPQGLQGIKGDTGSQGLTGEQGATGAEGLVGATGIEGTQGLVGETGLQGPAGPIAGSDKQFSYNDNGSAAGAEMYYDKSTSNIGIGTSSPIAKLHIQGGDVLLDGGGYNFNPDLAFYRGGTGFGILRRFNTDYTVFQIWAPPGWAGSNEATLAMVRGDEPNVEYFDLYNNGYPGETQHGIRIQKRGAGEYRDFVFDYSDGTTKTEVMRITPAGKIGFGTTSPTATLHVQGSTSPLFLNGSADVRIAISHDDSANAIAGLHVNPPYGGFHLVTAKGTHHVPTASDNDTYLSTRMAGNSLLFAVANQERMRLNGTTGNVGINITNPNQLLEIGNGNLGFYHGTYTAGEAEYTRIIHRAKNGAISGLYDPDAEIVFGKVNGFDVDWTHGSYLAFKTTGNNRDLPPSERMRITGDGSVGVGITSPLGVMHIVKSTGADTDSGVNLSIGQATPETGTWTRETANPNILVSDSGLLSDDGVLKVVDRQSYEVLQGFGFIAFGNSESAFFRFINGTITIISGTANVVTTDTDGKFCILGADAVSSSSSTQIRLKNRSGATNQVYYYIFYGSV